MHRKNIDKFNSPPNRKMIFKIFKQTNKKPSMVILAFLLESSKAPKDKPKF